MASATLFLVLTLLVWSCTVVGTEAGIIPTGVKNWYIKTGLTLKEVNPYVNSVKSKGWLVVDATGYGVGLGEVQFSLLMHQYQNTMYRWLAEYNIPTASLPSVLKLCNNSNIPPRSVRAHEVFLGNRWETVWNIVCLLDSTTNLADFWVTNDTMSRFRLEEALVQKAHGTITSLSMYKQGSNKLVGSVFDATTGSSSWNVTTWATKTEIQDFLAFNKEQSFLPTGGLTEWYNGATPNFGIITRKAPSTTQTAVALDLTDAGLKSTIKKYANGWIPTSFCGATKHTIPGVPSFSITFVKFTGAKLVDPKAA
eukprot:TRINITY_DN18598_c0_g1_i1.p1 TRINITY_DN18598_c0_g1~~TRINITY_DN18598_c0_g1_i1.p1  ORF type:complete len:310 (+),score=23.19 TRINITY_DN18598_c0_g1_i1:28-957(+)